MDDKNLYFIPILKRAFEDPDPVEAFGNALTEIIQLATDPAYANGYEQFETMFSLGLKDISKETNQFSITKFAILDRLLARIASDTFQGSKEIQNSLILYIKSNPELNQRFKEIQLELPTIDEKSVSMEVDIFRDDTLINTKVFSGKTQSAEFSGISPGNYQLKLSNGRVLWEGYIGVKDVIWKEAFPNRQYPMAAETEGIKTVLTRSFTLGDGNFKLFFEAGLESGKVVLSTIKKKND